MKYFLALVLFLYTLLSWVIFFRFEWALQIYAKNYPAFASFLFQSRQFLLTLYLNTIPTAIFFGLIFAVFAFYLLALKKHLTTKTVLIFAVLFQIIVMFSYPILSTDIYGYIVSDRLVTVHHSNVWTTLPNKFPEDKFFPLADYTNQVRIYGPVNQAIYTLPTALSGDDIITNVLVHKLVVIAFVIAAFFVTKKITSDPKVLGIIFWNPLFIVETAGSGHNDIVMLFFLLLGFLFFTKKRYLLSGILVALSVQVKTTPLLLLPFVLIFFTRRLEIKNLLVFFASFLLVYFATFSAMGTSLLALIERQGRATGANWQSLPLVIAHYASFLSPILQLLLPLVLVIQALRTFLGESPWRAFIETLFVYLLFFLPTLWNWYPLWVLAFAPLVYPLKSRFVGAALGVTFGAMLAYAIYWTGQRVDYFHSPIWQVLMYGSILISAAIGASYEKFLKKV